MKPQDNKKHNEETEVVELHEDENDNTSGIDFKERWMKVVAVIKHANKATIFGAVVTIFAVVGLVVTIIFAGKGIVGAVNNDKEKQMFEDMITPLVMLDPAPVEDMNKLGDKMIITAAIWDLILNEDKETFNNDDFAVYVPAADLEVHVKKLFGPDIAYSNMSVGDTEFAFDYSGETKQYMLPVELQFLSYKPKIEKIDKKGDVVLLKVGYIPQGSVWGKSLSDSYETQPFKYAEYELTKNGNDYIISSIRELPNETTSSTTSSSQDAGSAPSVSEPEAPIE